MLSRKYIGPGLLALLLFAAVYGVYLTRPGPPAAPRAPGARGQRAGPLVVDESSLERIKALLRMPTSPEERESAQSALRLADKATDLAFAQAVWRMASRPAAATPEAREIDARLQTSPKTLATDKRLTAATRAVRATSIRHRATTTPPRCLRANSARVRILNVSWFVPLPFTPRRFCAYRVRCRPGGGAPVRAPGE